MSIDTTKTVSARHELIIEGRQCRVEWLVERRLDSCELTIQRPRQGRFLLQPMIHQGTCWLAGYSRAVMYHANRFEIWWFNDCWPGWGREVRYGRHRARDNAHLSSRAAGSSKGPPLRACQAWSLRPGNPPSPHLPRQLRIRQSKQ